MHGAFFCSNGKRGGKRGKEDSKEAKPSSTGSNLLVCNFWISTGLVFQLFFSASVSTST